MLGSNPELSFTQAACVGEDPEWWFPTGRGTAAQYADLKAKRICARCPHQTACKQVARTDGLRGTWGGETEWERHAAGFIVHGLSGTKPARADQETPGQDPIPTVDSLGWWADR